MSARLTKVEFAEDGGFAVEPGYGGRSKLKERFAALQETLVLGELEATQTVGLHRRIKRAANEAAGLAWTTEFPLLLFPALFAEFARRERVRENRQQKILAQSQDLMDHAV